jgi:hypothetical protein
MLDNITSIFSLIVVGGIVIRVATNKQSAGTITSVFHGVGEDISASFG